MKTSDQDRIDAYLYKKMSEVQIAAFEKEIQQNEALAEALDLARLEQQTLRLIAQEELRSNMADWKAEKLAGLSPEAKVLPLTSSRRRYWLSAAASILLLITVPLWWASSNYNNRALTANVLGLKTSSTDRSNTQTDNPLLLPLDLIRAGQLEQALQELNKLIETPYAIKANLLKGEIYTEQENFSAAIDIYTKISNLESDLGSSEQAEWLLANVYLATNQETQAKSILDRISINNNHLKQKEALSLVKKLDSFWRKFSL